jgi:hypothetical protein
MKRVGDSPCSKEKDSRSPFGVETRTKSTVALAHLCSAAYPLWRLDAYVRASWYRRLGILRDWCTDSAREWQERDAWERRHATCMDWPTQLTNTAPVPTQQSMPRRRVRPPAAATAGWWISLPFFPSARRPHKYCTRILVNSSSCKCCLVLACSIKMLVASNLLAYLYYLVCFGSMQWPQRFTIRLNSFRWKGDGLFQHLPTAKFSLRLQTDEACVCVCGWLLGVSVCYCMGKGFGSCMRAECWYSN